ncbi:flagellar basal body L-ring protein FlgH [Magnetococcus sp. PR-3]|uniref:flagellar basal body L-ring protein FlgH n=1 Tax=Magnetococcus sp. PR-3 TaxID=3120355 RepID=UPI002FCE15B0
MRKNVQTMILGAVALALLSGCGMTRATQRPATPQAIIKAQPPELMNPNKGSLWNSGGRNTLFTDSKARFVGDLITVNVAETSSAQKSAKTELKREAESEVALGGLFGLTSALQSGGLSKFVDSNTMTGNHDHTGEGTTSRNSTFTATITCQVTEVMANGNLRIEGRRDITVNHENQFIILSGIIRPEDIANNNSVSSAQIADARIDYSGDGALDDQQKPSWLNRFFTNFRII